RFATNNAEAARFDSNGRFGINTTIPTQLLDVNGSINVSGTGGTIYVGQTQVCLLNGTNCPAAMANGGWLNSTTTVYLANNATNVSIGNNSGVSPNLFVDNQNNRVGMGTTTPYQTLDVIGSANITNTVFAT